MSSSTARGRGGRGRAAIEQQRVPDILTNVQKVRLIVDQIQAYQSQEFRLEMDRIANGDGEDDAIPNADIDPETNKPLTYKARKALLRKAQEAIRDEHEDLWPQVETFLAGAGFNGG